MSDAPKRSLSGVVSKGSNIQGEVSAQHTLPATVRKKASVTGNVHAGNTIGMTFTTDETLSLEKGVLRVNTTDQMEQDNTLPITSAGVFATVGNIEVLLKTI